MAATGQTINDRLNAVRYALAGQGLARTVCKATTEEILGPKKKHIDYLLACTDEPNISIPQLANLLIDRSQHTSWTVVFKSLITIHHLLDHGNERFTQYLATSNHSFELDDFMDRTTPQGYGMSTFVRLYAKYINSKISSYRTLAIDLCKVKPGKDNGLRTMNMENLSKTLPVVHNQFDTLLDFGPEPKDLNNGIIMAAFKLLYKDLNRIFAAYQEAIINLIERYFKLSRKKTREALNMYKKYLDRMDKVSNFFKIVEQAGLDKSEMPDTSKLVSLLGVLEEHMAQLEAKKRGTNVASPEPDDHGDEPVTSKKGTQQDPTHDDEQTKEQSTDESMKKATPEPPPKPTESPNTSGAPPKKAPPPARPSPAKLPAASQPDHKTSAPASKAPKEAEKRAPPERPSKPPSRPPPPSGPSHAVSPTPPSSSPQKASDSSSEQVSNDREPAKQKNDEPPSTSSPPEDRSHQKPETTEETTVETAAEPIQEPVTDSVPITETVTVQAEAAASSQINGSVSQAELSNGAQPANPSNGEGNNSDQNPSACSGSVNRTISQDMDELQLSGTNHVEDNNNVENHENNAEDEDPPSPPPPIDD